MPRTAGLMTLSQMTEKLTKAGIDPSRIIERAQLLAKARGAERKRKRHEDDMEVDGGEEGEEQAWMDVDEDGDDSPRKRRKGDDGKAQTVLYSKRAPKTDRTTIGMRDTSVCVLEPLFILSLDSPLFSKYRKRSSCETWDNVHEICWRKLGSRIGPSASKWCVLDIFAHQNVAYCLDQPKHLFAGKRGMGKTSRR